MRISIEDSVLVRLCWDSRRWGLVSLKGQVLHLEGDWVRRAREHGGWRSRSWSLVSWSLLNPLHAPLAYIFLLKLAHILFKLPWIVQCVSCLCNSSLHVGIRVRLAQIIVNKLLLLNNLVLLRQAYWYLLHRLANLRVEPISLALREGHLLLVRLGVRLHCWGVRKILETHRVPSQTSSNLLLLLVRIRDVIRVRLRSSKWLLLIEGDWGHIRLHHGSQAD